MKTNLLYTILGFFVAFSLMSNSNGRASTQNADNTNAPGANGSCGNAYCHGGTEETNVSIEVLYGDDVVEDYLPGEVYTINVTIEKDAVGYGFQMVSLTEENNEPYNAWSIPSTSTNVKEKTISDSGRSFVEQNGTSTSNTFSIEWTAPEVSTGAIKFYASGNAVNGDGQTSGDITGEQVITLEEALGASINNVFAHLNFNSFAKEGQLFVQFDSQEFTAAKYELLTIDGKQINKGTWEFQGASTQTIDLNQTSGIYLLVLEIDGRRGFHKFLSL